MKVLVTGGAGYIGSHTVIELLNQGHQVVVLDNLERGYLQALERIKQITGKEVPFIQADLRHLDQLQQLNQHLPLDAVIHFAAYKDVGEADNQPGLYFQNNVFGSLNLLEFMANNSITNVVFSSTSAIYGDSDVLPMHEDLPLKPKNAYGQSKAAVEWILKDFYQAHQINSVALRYFNAAGAHQSGQLGEDPARSGNIIPLIMQTLVGQREKFKLYGNTFPTSDGTQLRDYIHVSDLATGHLAALQKLQQDQGAFIYNLGTGVAHSNQELISLAEQISGKTLTYEVVDPRPGDPITTVSDPTKAQQELNWKAQYSIQQIIQDQWNWVSHNPQGYPK